MRNPTRLDRLDRAYSAEERGVLGFQGLRFPYNPNPFTRALMEAFAVADLTNFDRLARGYPELANAWKLWRAGRLA